MPTNTNRTRVVRVRAIDLAYGDLIVRSEYDPVGRVESVPELGPYGQVYFHLCPYGGITADIRVVAYSDGQMVRIEIERRTS